MKKMRKIFKNTISAALLSGMTLLVSCTDFLTIYPANDIIHENFWQTVDDVNGMMATGYLQLLSKDAVERMVVWGELRGDNMCVRKSSSNITYKYIVEGNLRDDNSYCNWAVFYRAINYANLVLEFAPLVVERDPNFTQGDCDIVMGEMYALRAMAHFYLVRTFRDIPLSYKASLNDSDLGTYPQVHPCVALDSIMNDLDRADALVMRTGGFPNSVNSDFNYSRITRDAVRAMKTDVNLWRAAFATYYQGADSVQVGNPDDYYRMAIACSDSVINSYMSRIRKFYDENKIKVEAGPGTDNPYYLAQNIVSKLEPKYSTVYDNFFGSGKDFTESFFIAERGEILFELKFDETKNVNSAISGLYGNSNDGLGTMCVNKNYVKDSKDNIYKESDLRVYSYTNIDELGSNNSSGVSEASDEVGIAKYVYKTSPAFTGDARTKDNFDANWVIYRLTDVMLMKAEALAHLSTSTREDLDEAYHIVKAVNNRSLTYAADSLRITDYTSSDDVAKLVLDERVRELAFEGKRWYDLVRVALRDKSTANILFVADKVEGASSAVRKKMQSIHTIFFPIAESEMNVNSLLVQNPAYETSSSIEQN